MYNPLIDGLPNSYKGFELNTSFRVALKIQELLEDPRINSENIYDKMAAYMVAISYLYKDANLLSSQKLSLEEAVRGVYWWLSCGENDTVINYWKRTGIMPDVDSNEFDRKDYETPPDNMIDVDVKGKDGKLESRRVSRFSVLAFDAPDGTTRYAKKSNGDPELISLLEDASLIYSGFYKIYRIDLATEEIHWFKFCWLLSELETTEGTLIQSKIKTRSFNSADYKGKNYAEYRSRMEKLKHDNRVLGILPYIDGG